MNRRLPTIHTSTEAIRALEVRRNELDITQAELARQCGMNRRTMHAFLAGHTEISLRRFFRLAAALCLTLQSTPELDCEERPTPSIQMLKDRDGAPPVGRQAGD